MYIIVGLGNPGKKYETTRHNVGFMVVDRMVERLGEQFRKGRGNYFLSRANLSMVPVIFVKPLTYMNLSGQAVREVIDYFKVDDYSKILIISDDFNLAFGKIRLRSGGSSGGQKGLKSILQILRTDEIARLRIGIGNEFENPSSFVLAAFNQQEKKILSDIIEHSADAVESFIAKGIDETMNFYNRNLSL